MRVVVRADASVAIGTGHVMRCLTLAEALRTQGHRAEFICREAEGDLTKFIESEKGFSVHRLPKAGLHEEDARQSAAYLQKNASVDWLVVDHYSLDEAWETQLRPHTKRLMVIDDLADRPHRCDLLLDQNFADDAARYDALAPNHCTKLLGPEYALLRPEFAEARAHLPERHGKPERLLLSFGGSDPTGETVKVLRQLQAADATLELHIDCVVGASHPALDEVKNLVEALPNVRLHTQTRQIAVLMARADLCLGAGGSTLWERCCLGLPTLTVAISEHQVPFCERLAKLGYLVYLGDVSRKRIDYLRALREAVVSINDLRALAKKGMTLVDGEGRHRVVMALEGLKCSR